MNSGYSKPKQKIPFSQKTKTWADDTAKYYRDTCVEAVDPAEALKNYRLANGQLDEKEYLYVTNPLNTKRPELLGSPARLYNWDIITPNISLLLGEKTRRQFPPIVYAKNSNYHILKQEEQKRLFVQELQKRFVNEAIAMGIPLDQEQITMQLEEIPARVKNLPDELATLGQNALEYIMDYNHIPRHHRKGFFDWICQACVYSYKDVHKNETLYIIISPVHIKYLCSEIHDFINKGEAVTASYTMSANEIYDRFQDADGFTKEVEDHINDYANMTSSSIGANLGYTIGSTDIISARNEFFDTLFGNKRREDYSSGLRVEHVMWRSLTKRGKLIRQDITGEIIEDIVSEDFKPVEGDIITWDWYDEIWENYCIDDKYWLAARVVPIQVHEKADLLYNGRNMMARHTRPKPLVKRGEAYQKSVNIIKYRAEATLAKNLDKIVLFPLGLIPKKEGWDEDKLMYFVRSFSFLFFDDTRPNAHLLINAMKDLDMSSLQHVMQAYEIVQVFKQEWDESCGINPQRKGQVSASAGKGVTQQATDRSYVMSEEMFLEYEEFEREEYEGLLELSKYAFSNGKQAHFVRQDGTTAFLDLHDPTSFLWADFGVFVKNSARELQKLEILRDQVTAFAQNAVDPKMISAIVEAENFSKLHQVMDEVEAKMDARTAQAQQVEMEIAASTERVKKQELDFKYYNADLVSQTDIQVALIDAGIQMADQARQMEAAGTNNTEEYSTLLADRERNAIELVKNATKIKEIASKEKMNKLDNKTALKNKTAGEK